MISGDKELRVFVFTGQKVGEHYCEREDAVYHTDVIKDSLKSFCDIIGCDIVDFKKVTIGGRDYIVIFDDEWYLQPRLPVSMAHKNKEKVVCGTIIIAREIDSDGNILGIEDDDIKNIEASIVSGIGISKHNGQRHPIKYIQYS